MSQLGVKPTVRSYASVSQPRVAQRVNPVEAGLRSASLQADNRKQKRGFFDAVYGQLKKRGLA